MKWILLFLLVFACEQVPVAPQEGRRAPSIVGTSLDGVGVDLTTMSGKPTMVVFWASWCGPCRQEAPEIAAIASGYNDQLQLLGVNTGEDQGTARRAAEAMQMTWPVLIDRDGQIAAAYQVESIPLVLILDGEGIVRYRGNGLPSNTHRIVDGLMR